jgi:hypothetical protein
LLRGIDPDFLALEPAQSSGFRVRGLRHDPKGVIAIASGARIAKHVKEVRIHGPPFAHQTRDFSPSRQVDGQNNRAECRKYRSEAEENRHHASTAPEVIDNRMGWSCRVIENRDVISLGKTRRVGADGFAELAPPPAFVREDDDGGIANRASRAIAVAFDMADEFRDGSLRSCRF